MKSSKGHKVYSKFRARTWDSIIVPEIRFEGKWLEKLGFKTGQEIDVEKMQDKITITPRQQS